MLTQTRTAYKIVWAEQHHLPAVAKIASQSLAQPWTLAEFSNALWSSDTRIQIVKRKAETVGYVAYVEGKDCINIYDLAVPPWARKQGVATEMLRYLKSRKKVIEIIVGERNLFGQLFLRGRGFRWVATVPEHVSDDEAGYIMRWRGE